MPTDVVRRRLLRAGRWSACHSRLSIGGALCILCRASRPSSAHPAEAPSVDVVDHFEAHPLWPLRLEVDAAREHYGERVARRCLEAARDEGAGRVSGVLRRACRVPAWRGLAWR
jgi:hypothetical protein